MDRLLSSDNPHDAYSRMQENRAMAQLVADEERKLSDVADGIQQQVWTEAFGKKSADAF